MDKRNKIVVLGGGESGVGAAILASKKGWKVFVSDNNEIKEKYKSVLIHYDIDFEENGHNLPKLETATLAVKSPGIPDGVPAVKSLKAKGIPIISEIEFAGRYTSAKTICITGSNGKTTTTMLTGHILKSAGLHAGVAGNVGKSFAWQVAENDFDVYVLEISSFQLDGMFGFKADIAVLLNITPDHLDRYNNDFKQYTDSKFRIIQNQTKSEAFIFCSDDKVIVKEMEKRKIASQLYPFSLNNTGFERVHLSTKTTSLLKAINPNST